MKITKTYLSGCTWCGALGVIESRRLPHQTVSSSLTEICPVCNGAKTVVVTEIIEDNIESIKIPK
jgi:hypothetical protein